MRKLTKKQGSIIFFSLFVIVLTYFAWDTIKRTRIDSSNNLSYSFKNIVEDVSYDIKGTPKVLIEKRYYYLSDGYNFNHLIENGDSLIKEKGSTKYILVKRQTGKVIEFNNQEVY